MQSRDRYLNARDTLTALFNFGIIPIINENDAVAIAEIKVGDNDNLAALSAILAEADCVILLTDQKGLYTADPRANPDATLIRDVHNIDEHLIESAGGAGSSQGTGGMATKLKAARTATAAGVELIIASGAEPQIVLDLVEGKGEATFFYPCAHPVLARKAWIGSATAPEGVLIVDEGAYRALCERNSSLLPRGILEVQGQFMRGATVAIKSAEQGLFARGLVRYGSDELNLIKRQHSDTIERVLGYTHGDVAVHRDDLVLIDK